MEKREVQLSKKPFLLLSCSVIFCLNSLLYAQDADAEILNDKGQPVNGWNDTGTDTGTNLQSKITEKNKNIAIVQREKKAAEKQLNRLKQAIYDNNTKYFEARDSIEEQTSKIRKLQNELNPLLEKISNRENLLKKRIQSLQENGGNINYLAILLNTSSLKDLVTRIEAITTFVEADTAIIDGYETNKEKIVYKQDQIREELKSLLEQQKELQGIFDVINDQKEQQEILVSELARIESGQIAERNSLLTEQTLLMKKEVHTLQTSIQNTPSFKIIVPGDGVPPQYMEFYIAGEKKYGVDWDVLAAIHRVETGFSTNVQMSVSGAIGHMQFMPATWEKYGVDADGNGKADPFSIADSIMSAAHYLSASGYAANPKKAIYAYNHADWYVNDVLRFADEFKKGASIQSLNNSNVITAGERWIGNSVYVFGGGRDQQDIQQGRFDCSSFVHWAFKQVGKDLGPLASVSTDTLKNKGVPISINDIKPGDLVFFDTYKTDGHVGIYVGNGKFIGAQSGSGVAIADMTSGYWKQKFNGRVKRL